MRFTFTIVIVSFMQFGWLPLLLCIIWSHACSSKRTPTCHSSSCFELEAKHRGGCRHVPPAHTILTNLKLHWVL